MTTHDRQTESSEAIRASISQTRSEMGAKIDAIQNRLDPENIKDQAQEAFYSVIEDGADALAGYVRNQAVDLGSVSNTIKRNPLPAALVGLGLGWIVLESLSNNGNSSSEHYGAEVYGIQSTGSNPYRPDPYSPSQPTAGYGRHADGINADATNGAMQNVKQQAAEIADNVQEIVSDVQDTLAQKARGAAEQVSEAIDSVQQKGEMTKEQSAYLSRQASVGIQRTINDNPLAFGVAALAAGAMIGLVLPATRTENRMMGQASDQLLDSAQSVAQDAMRRASQVAEEVGPELQNSAEKFIDDVKQVGRETTDSVQQSLQEAQSKMKERSAQAADSVQETLKETRQEVKKQADAVESKAAREAEKVKRATAPQTTSA